MSIKDNIQELSYQGIRWINIEHPDKTVAEYLQSEFKVHHLDCEDILSVTHRSKIDKYAEYIFIILLFPVYNPKTKQIEPAEIDFFLGKDYVITIHRGDIPTFVDLFQLCKASEETCAKILTNSAQLLLYNIMQRLFQNLYPILDNIDLETQALEEKIFGKDGQTLAQELLLVRQNILDMRKIVQPHQAIISRLMKPPVDLGDHQKFQLDKEYDDYFDDIFDYSEETWNQLESFKESVDALHETNASLMSFRINEIMKTLTVFSVIMLPAGVVAGIFGMNAHRMIFVGSQFDFWAMTFIVVSAAILTFMYIRKKHLL